MKSVAAVTSCLVLALAGFFVFASGIFWPDLTLDAESGSSQYVAGYENYIDLTSSDLGVVGSAISEIDRGWHPGSPMMMIEAARFSANLSAFEKIFGLLERKTKQPWGRDFDRWHEWVWEQQYTPHPQYARYKGVLYSRVDNRFPEYFENTENAKIRLDEIRWGGVVRDGIPPLAQPGMISAKNASYLDDSNVVFGVELNGDARCYPKRVLAWHEMFKDTIGGIPVCGVY